MTLDFRFDSNCKSGWSVLVLPVFILRASSYPSPLKNVKLLRSIPFLLTTLYVDNPIMFYVIKSNCFVVHLLMLVQSLINSADGFSGHCVISILAALSRVSKRSSAPTESSRPCTLFLVVPRCLPTPRCTASFPSAIW